LKLTSSGVRAGAMAYLVNHHQKQAQTPPRSWSGKRLRPSKGYYEIPAPQLRELANRDPTLTRIPRPLAVAATRARST